MLSSGCCLRQQLLPRHYNLKSYLLSWTVQTWLLLPCNMCSGCPARCAQKNAEQMLDENLDQAWLGNASTNGNEQPCQVLEAFLNDAARLWSMMWGSIPVSFEVCVKCCQLVSP